MSSTLNLVSSFGSGSWPFAASPRLLLKLIVLLIVCLTVRGWNPAAEGPADIEEVKVVNDQHTPDSASHPSIQAAECKHEQCQRN